MVKLSDVPSWWLDMAKTWDATELLTLAREVGRRGVSKNDRRAVEAIYREIRIAKAFGVDRGAAA